MRFRLLIVMSAVFLVACGPPPSSGHNDNTPADAAWTHQCDFWGDDDGDTIYNGDEGCMYGDYGRDSNHDGVPDYLDRDSDGDGIPDSIETGDASPQTPPRDTDGDGVPDYLDLDSDNDGVADGEEDRNGDGMVGHCRTDCDPSGQGDQCGPGQFCLASGKCDPPVVFECAGGETDPLNSDTDGDGVPDSQEGSFICNKQTEDNPYGRKPVQYQTTSKFQIGISVKAKYVEERVMNKGDERCDNGTDDDGDSQVDCDDSDCLNTTACGGAAAVFDLPEQDDGTAGFVLAREPAADNVQEEALAIRNELAGVFGTTHVNMRASGAARVSHDLMPTVVSAVVDLSGLDRTNIIDVRNKLLAGLMGREVSEYSALPEADAYTDEQGNPIVLASDTTFVVAFTVQYRYEKSGDPPDPPSGDMWVVVMGAVSRLGDYSNYDQHAIQHLEDASNGTCLAGPTDGQVPECEAYSLSRVPKADIIWVIDESGSMSEEQQSVASNAVDFFNRAQAYGLDFRMGVVDVNIENNGVFCTGNGQSADQFLGPGDLNAFQACAIEPWGALQPEGGAEYGLTQGLHAIQGHLPRADNDSKHIRTDAQLVIIYVSDERPDEVEDAGCADEFDNDPPIDPNCLQPVIQPTLDLLTGLSDPEGAGVAHAIVSPPPGGCSTATETGRGYSDIVTALGGQIGSVCQTDLGPTMQVIIEDIVANSSPIVLRHVPISVSITCAKDGEALDRSRRDGFDYRASANTIVFIGQDFDPLHPSEILVSYERWVTSVVPQ
ncbi:MAG: VWA domain-containing protein [Deltaproteobacteria bacterium]|nr:VWA domain-containing protein [Deltaproteobacteria bacterium]